jgi:predicted transcriptional regulator
LVIARSLLKSIIDNLCKVERTALAIQLVHEYGLSLAETARQLGVSTSAIAKND